MPRSLQQSLRTYCMHPPLTSSDHEQDPLTEILLPVEGMECASCVVRVEKQLKKRSDVDSAEVNLANQVARVAYHADQTDLASLIETVEKTGFSIPLTVTTLPLNSGLDLDSAALEHVFSHTNGVIAIETIKDDTGVQAHIRHINSIVPPAQLKQLLAHHNYLGQAQVDQQQETEGTAEVQSAYRKLFRRFLISALLSLPVIVISMSHEGISFTGVNYWLFALTTPVVLWAGYPFFAGAAHLLRYRTADMNSLIALGVGSAYLYSTVATFLPDLFIETGQHPDIYFEAAAAIITLVLLGRLMEARAKHKTGAALE